MGIMVLKLMTMEPHELLVDTLAITNHKSQVEVLLSHDVCAPRLASC